MAEARFPFEPDYAVPPGETLKEWLETAGITVTWLSIGTGIPIAVLLEVLDGTAPITPAMAVLLGAATDIPARMWNNLEAEYRKRKEHDEETEV